LNRIEDILSWDEITLVKFFHILEEEAKLISLQDIMQASIFLVNDARYVQESYRKEYLKSYTSAFIIRVKELVGRELKNDTCLDMIKVKEAIKLLISQEEVATGENGFDPVFFQIYKIVALYTTFILEESVHPVNTPFPGGFKVKFDKNKYLCPVKERQKGNPGAVCGFCIAEQDPDTI
jgi:uncharacterized protein (UPF0305 family)